MSWTRWLRRQCLLAAATNATAQQPEHAARLLERVSAHSDSSHHYALALPAGFDPSARSWPVLFILDPRGQALSALERFRPSAEAHGWVILSSYETASDDPDAPNVAAVNAMLADAQDRWGADSKRMYFAGFSGTARLAWSFANEIRGHAAGVIMAGAGLASFPELLATTRVPDATLTLVGSVGTRDFNWSEVRATSEAMRSSPLAHRFWSFEGPHSWPPTAIAGDMVEWLEARAMTLGLAPADSAWLTQWRVSQLRSADSLQRAGHLDAALDAFDDLHLAFPASVEGAIAEAAARELANLPRLQTFRSERLAVERQEDQAIRRGATVLNNLRAGTQPNSARSLVDRLDIRALQNLMTRGDSLHAPSATRRLEYLFVSLSFYEPRAYLAAGDSSRARTVLEVARAIDPIRATRAAAQVGISLSP